MRWKQFKKQFRYYSQYIPFTVNTVLYGGISYFAYKLLYKQTPKGEEPSSIQPFIILMGKMVFWFLIAAIAVSVLSTLAGWIYYLWLHKNKGCKLQVTFTSDEKNNRQQNVNAELEGTFRPLLGFIKGRLFYDDLEMTDRFSLLSNRRKEKSLFRKSIFGRNRLLLPDIKEYQLKGGFIYFEDMLRLFSLAAAQPLSGEFYQKPSSEPITEREVAPKKTETTDIRIDQLRRVEGEHLNYKDFESGDDVRRIVWKLYAKNRELVVRIPELFEPYASHLYFYISFHNALKTDWLGDSYFREMLNYYKNNTWAVYEALSKRDWQIRYIPDQQFSIQENMQDADKNARIISNSTWQADKPVDNYFNPKQGSVLCISSLTDIESLRSVLNVSDASTVIYFIKLSGTFRHNIAWHWFKRLIFRPTEDRLNKLRSTWIFSPLRLQIQRKEKEIEKMLSRGNCTVVIL